VRRTQTQEGTGTTSIQEDFIDVKGNRSRQLMSQLEISEYILETQKLKDLDPTPLDTTIGTRESGARQDCQDTSEKHPTFIEHQRLQLLRH
jgi:hypothetical protein